MKNIKLKNLLMIAIAGVINSIGVVCFLSAVNLYDGGISGTSMLLYRLTSLPLSLFLLILNIPLFVYGYKRQGFEFTFYAIFSVVIYSVIAAVLPNLFDLSNGSPFAQNDYLLCAIFGGLMSGVGSGLTIRYGGAMDGIEVMGVIFAKKLNLTIGTFVMIYNAILYCIGAVLFGSWILPLYSIIAYYINSKVVDLIVEGLDRSKAAMIITEKGDEIIKLLSEGFESSGTLMNGKGGYSNTNKQIIYFVVNSFEIAKLKEIVHQCDPKAYITITEIADVFRNNGNNG